MFGDPRQGALGRVEGGKLAARYGSRDFWADSPSVFTVMALSGGVDTGRLGFVRQRKFID